MIFKVIGDKNLPAIMLLHGGGLSDWSWQQVGEELREFHIITPIIDGHGEDGKTEFKSIENSAAQVIEFIDKQYGGKVYVLGGLSIGAQIAIEVLSKRCDIAQYAIVESALAYPLKLATALTIPLYRWAYGLIKNHWLAKMQAKTLGIPGEMFAAYYRDSRQISRESLINMALSNGNYSFKDSIAQTNARVLIIAGAKEIAAIKKSAVLLHNTIPASELYIAAGMGHGEMSLKHPQRYAEILKAFLAKTR